MKIRLPLGTRLDCLALQVLRSCPQAQRLEDLAIFFMGPLRKVHEAAARITDRFATDWAACRTPQTPSAPASQELSKKAVRGVWAESPVKSYVFLSFYEGSWLFKCVMSETLLMKKRKADKLASLA